MSINVVFIRNIQYNMLKITSQYVLVKIMAYNVKISKYLSIAH